jgi:O-antigen/teichoic acid export membrane protein
VFVTLLLMLNPAVSRSGALAGTALALAQTMAMAVNGMTVAIGQAPRAQAGELCVRLPLHASLVAILLVSDLLSGPALALATAIATSAYVLMLTNGLPLRASRHREVPRRLGNLLGRFVTTASVNATLFTLMSTMDVVLGSLLITAEMIAPLGVAGRLAGSLALLHGAVFEFHGSTFARSLRRRDKEVTARAFQRIALESTALTLATMIAAGIAIAFMPHAAPEAYQMAVMPLWVLLGARLITGALGPAQALLTLGGRHTTLGTCTAIAIGLEALLIILLARPLGAIGLAIATGCGMVAHVAIARVATAGLLGRRSLEPARSTAMT